MNLTPVQNGWLKLADIKTSLFDELQRAELAVQDYINGVDGNPLDVIQHNIKSAKQVMADAKWKRLEFTRMIDEKLIIPATAFEKRMADNIKDAEAVELKIRIDAAENAEKQQAIANEAAALKAHIVNEWFRIAAQYRYELEKVTLESYSNCIKNRVPVDQLEAMTSDMERILNAWNLSEFQKFDRKLISDGHAKEIYDSIEKYNPANDLKTAIKNISAIWSTYSNDLANADVAIESIEKHKQVAEMAMKMDVEFETATNSLIAEAETLIVDTPKVKKELKIVVVESEQWAKTIVANFVRLWPYCNKFVRVKSWSKLTIGQMSDALAKHINETGNVIPGIETEEICK
jgi:endonuclease YncB( thermonuclease family)